MRRLLLAAACAVALGASGPAMADSGGIGGYSATFGYGVVPSGVPGATESANNNYTNGATAGQVEAVKRGMIPGSNYSVYNIGVQNSITNNQYGNGNSSNFGNGATQNGQNNGQLNNNGNISR